MTIPPVLSALISTLGRRAVALGTQVRGIPRQRWPLIAAGVLALILTVIFPVTMVFISRIDDNPDFTAPNQALGRSHALEVTAALITRELEVNKWRANDPFFIPGGWLRAMPAFQIGMVTALAHSTGALAAENGVGWTSSGGDVNLEHAAGLLKYPGTVWKFDTRKSWMPTASAEKQYRNAQRSIDAYNTKLATGTASFERSPQALALVVEALIGDLDDTAQAINSHMEKDLSITLDFSITKVFYRNKGRLYANSIVMREIGRDFETVLAQRNLTESWIRMVEYLAIAARPRPSVVWGARPDSSMLPNHLIAQGYPTLQARQIAASILASLKSRESQQP
ncbi:DUF2333 family protein [Magnetospirillum molischianum]|uniref:DUF2333 family protein n=1 Tax=Magnetospirillum molischianum DSM 120 TaxID=1150626 RepID=H8FVR0_MAGML|nr:DUF2333 family protein [Magnetospirillum molischianum]CCG42448.1 conserved exported hypothetical protein [Magnetospirillum molischianum DSM 120]